MTLDRGPTNDEMAQHLSFFVPGGYALMAQAEVDRILNESEALRIERDAARRDDATPTLPAKVTDEMVERAANAIGDQLDRGYRGHYCAEWDDGHGCQRCREIARSALEAALR